MQLDNFAYFFLMLVYKFVSFLLIFSPKFVSFCKSELLSYLKLSLSEVVLCLFELISTFCPNASFIFLVFII